MENSDTNCGGIAAASTSALGAAAVVAVAAGAGLGARGSLVLAAGLATAALVGTWALDRGRDGGARPDDGRWTASPDRPVTVGRSRSSGRTNEIGQPPVRPRPTGPDRSHAPLYTDGGRPAGDEPSTGDRDDADEQHTAPGEQNESGPLAGDREPVDERATAAGADRPDAKAAVADLQAELERLEVHVLNAEIEAAKSDGDSGAVMDHVRRLRTAVERSRRRAGLVETAVEDQSSEGRTASRSRTTSDGQPVPPDRPKYAERSVFAPDADDASGGGERTGDTGAGADGPDATGVEGATGRGVADGGPDPDVPPEVRETNVDDDELSFEELLDL